MHGDFVALPARELPPTVRQYLQGVFGRPLRPTDRIMLDLFADQSARRQRAEQLLSGLDFGLEKAQEITDLLAT